MSQGSCKLLNERLSSSHIIIHPSNSCEADRLPISETSNSAYGRLVIAHGFKMGMSWGPEVGHEPRLFKQRQMPWFSNYALGDDRHSHLP